jgi:Arc/MetJ family transcription regulator
MHHCAEYLEYMRITVEIDAAVLDEVMAITGEKSKSPAVARAVAEYVRRIRAREFGRLMREGAFDYPEAAGSGEAGAEDPGNPVPPMPEA